MNAALRCSDASELAQESLGATATHAESWLLVEVPGTWARDVADDGADGARVREAEELDAIADLRVVCVEGDQVLFRSWDGREHVAVVEEAVGAVVPASCGADAAAQAAFSARVV